MTNDLPFHKHSEGDHRRLVEENPFAWIVSGEGERFCANLMPVRPWKVEGNRIVQLAGHLPRRREQVAWLEQDPRAHILFLGPHAYVSSSWVTNRRWTPTWNYTSAAFEVDIEFVGDGAPLREILRDLVDSLEAGRENAWVIEEMGPRYAELSKYVIGFIAHVRDARERYKLGQDEEPANYRDIVDGLERDGEHRLLEWMRRFNPGKEGEE